MENKNVLMKWKNHKDFSWVNFGNNEEEDRDMNEKMSVLFYRLMQCTMLSVLSRTYGLEQASHIFRQAGLLAGNEFAQNALDLTVETNKFFSDLQKTLRDSNIGILSIDDLGHGVGNILFTDGQELDCKWAPVTSKNMSAYDEGFIAGILDAYEGML